MHYTGMFAMRMSPPIHYDPLLVAVSILIAMGGLHSCALAAKQMDGTITAASDGPVGARI